MATGIIDRLLGRGKSNLTNSVVVDPEAKAKTGAEMKAEAMAFVKRFKHGARNVNVEGTDRDILKFLASRRIVILDDDVATICPGVFSCTRCREFSGAKSKFERVSCIKRKVELELPGLNTTKARGCSDFYLKILD
jgi:hypothetical protein